MVLDDTIQRVLCDGMRNRPLERVHRQPQVAPEAGGCAARNGPQSRPQSNCVPQGTGRHRPMRTKIVAGRCVGRGELGKLVAVRVEDVGRA
eukprot:3097476-Prymnesium_polylepis.1